MSDTLIKRQKDYRSALHSYIKFCKYNEETFYETPNADNIPDFQSKTEGGKRLLSL